MSANRNSKIKKEDKSEALKKTNNKRKRKPFTEDKLVEAQAHIRFGIAPTQSVYRAILENESKTSSTATALDNLHTHAKEKDAKSQDDPAKNNRDEKEQTNDFGRKTTPKRAVRVDLGLARVMIQSKGSQKLSLSVDVNSKIHTPSSDWPTIWDKRKKQKTSNKDKEVSQDEMKLPAHDCAFDFKK